MAIYAFIVVAAVDAAGLALLRRRARDQTEVATAELIASRAGDARRAPPSRATWRRTGGGRTARSRCAPIVSTVTSATRYAHSSPGSTSWKNSVDERDREDRHERDEHRADDEHLVAVDRPRQHGEHPDADDREDDRRPGAQLRLLDAERHRAERVQVSATAMMMPAGIAKLSDRLRNPGTYRCVFGISARKNAGMPIVSPSVIDSCRGRNGNSSTRMPNRIASPVA